MKMTEINKPKLLDLAKQTIADCSDIHCFDPETNVDTGVGMALSERIKIIHQFDDGKLYLFEDKADTLNDLFEVTEDSLIGFQSLLGCMKEMEV